MEDMRKHSAQCQQCLSGIDNDMILDQFDCDHVHICEIMCSMTTPRLCPHLLLIDSYGGWVQVNPNYTNWFWLLRYFPSSCDSRNLNLSPFCNLTSTSLAMWQPSVLETYGNQTTSYINTTSGPMRRNFPNSMGERELITSLTKVLLIHWI